MNYIFDFERLNKIFHEWAQQMSKILFWPGAQILKFSIDIANLALLKQQCHRVRISFCA